MRAVWSGIKLYESVRWDAGEIEGDAADESEDNTFGKDEDNA